MKTYKGEKYLLHWTKNPFYWNDNIKDIKKNPNIIKQNGRYYTIVIAHFTGCFSMVDCTCDMKTGDFYPINVSLLKDYNYCYE